MDVSPYVAQLREDLTTAASAGDDQTRRTAALLSAAIEPAARLAIMNALSDLAAEVTEALGDRTVELRLDGRDVQVSVGGTSTPDGDGTAPHGDRAGSDSSGSQDAGGFGGFRGFGGLGGFGGTGGQPTGPDAGDISRVTLRIVEQIKAQAEQAAQSQGVSLNTWVAQAVQGALAGVDQRARPGPSDPDRPDDDGRRLRGWVQG